jgi:hypothetical protein
LRQFAEILAKATLSGDEEKFTRIGNQNEREAGIRY